MSKNLHYKIFLYESLQNNKLSSLLNIYISIRYEISRYIFYAQILKH